MEIRQFQNHCMEAATAKGWNDKPIPIPEQIALLHSEASEALEAYRNQEPLLWTKENGSPEGIAAEYADIVIRVCHYASVLGFDLEDVLEQKMAYNATRAHRHGGKIA